MNDSLVCYSNTCILKQFSDFVLLSDLCLFISLNGTTLTYSKQGAELTLHKSSFQQSRTWRGTVLYFPGIDQYATIGPFPSSSCLANNKNCHHGMTLAFWIRIRYMTYINTNRFIISASPWYLGVKVMQSGILKMSYGWLK